MNPVHPHTSGEYLATPSCPCVVSGSSPHKWGIQCKACEYEPMSRFIPTQVGNTTRETAVNLREAVHPHTSGEYIATTGSFSPTCGSSPHKWGILASKPILNCRVRFIPTQVGNTSGFRPYNPLSAVHPHTSGEYLSAGFFSMIFCGSSPHKWGIRLRCPP